MILPSASASRARTAFCVLLCIVTGLWLTSSRAHASLPQGFVVESAFPGVFFDLPVAVAFLPDGGALVAEKAGRVQLVRANGTKALTPFLDVSADVIDLSDLGLLGLAVDPDFGTNRWVYIAYTVDAGGDDRYSRLVRYQANSSDPEVADLSTRQVLIGGDWSEGVPTLHTTHSVCALRFAPDKSLLVGHGDGGHFEYTDLGGNDPGGFGPEMTDPEEDVGAFRARTLRSLAGKILRLDKETGFGLPSNPFWDDDPSSDASRTWIYGLRNPFRFSLRPGTGSTDPADGDPGTLYIGDVGWNRYEELDVAPTGGRNFGWPCREGVGVNAPYYNADSTAAGNENVICTAEPTEENPAIETAPTLWWHHTTTSLSNPSGLTAGSLTGGVFYEGGDYPASYTGRYFVADFVQNWLLVLNFDASDQLLGYSYFSGEIGRPVDFQLDPANGDVCFAAVYNGTVKRISYQIESDVDDGALGAGILGVRLGNEAIPNPFAASTAISLELESGLRTTVDIFDLGGRRVRNVLPEADRGAGTYQVSWDGRDENGRLAASGVYFLVLRTPRGSESRKIVLARE